MGNMIKIHKGCQKVNRFAKSKFIKRVNLYEGFQLVIRICVGLRWITEKNYLLEQNEFSQNNFVE